MKAAWHLPLLLLVTGLGACGGGGGSSAPPPPPPPPPPAFALSSAVPADAASGVARDAVMTASFNATLDATSVNAGTVTLTGPGNNAIPATLAVTGGSTVEVRPKAGALPADTGYTLALSAAIKDSTGRTLPQAVTRTFSTASASWSATAGALASLPSFTSGTGPSICTDAAGHTTAAWLTQQGTLAYALYAARLDSVSGGWSTPAAVTVENNGTLAGAQLAPGPAGDVFLVWSRDVFGGDRRNQLARYSASAGTWSAPVDLVTEPASSGYGAGYAIPISDASGNLTLLTSDGHSLYATRLNAGGSTWSAPRAIEHPFANNSLLFLTKAVADAQGNIVVAWMQTDEGGRAIYAARYDAATAQWAAAQHVASTPANGIDPIGLGVDGAGVATLGWTLSAGIAGGDTIWASRLDAQGKAWSPAVRVDVTDPAAPDARGVLLAVDGAGTATALWSQGSSLRTARWAPGAAGWSAPTVVAPAGVPLQAASQMLADAAGNLVVLGPQLDQKLVATRYLATTGQWQASFPVSTPGTGNNLFNNAPAASMDGAGNAVAVWFAQNRVGAADQYVLSFNRLR